MRHVLQVAGNLPRGSRWLAGFLPSCIKLTGFNNETVLIAAARFVAGCSSSHPATSQSTFQPCPPLLLISLF